MNQPKDPASWLESIIKGFIRESPENTLKDKDNERAFEEPLIGFAGGADPLFEDYKFHVGEFHWTPVEAFHLAFPGEDARPEELTVISWILPQTAATKADNRRMKDFPCERWARARIFGEEVNVKLRRHVVTVLQQSGYAAFAPALLPQWGIRHSEKYDLCSTWSERHAAHASGLGTFGLCDGLITPLGKAMRVGSVIARIAIPATPRPYKHHREYCLFFTKGTCKKCIDRCPAGALSEKGHDKVKCRAYVIPVTQDYVKAHYGFDGYGCGLCQTRVPCESKIPTQEDRGQKSEG